MSEFAPFFLLFSCGADNLKPANNKIKLSSGLRYAAAASALWLLAESTLQLP